MKAQFPHDFVKGKPFHTVIGLAHIKFQSHSSFPAYFGGMHVMKGLKGSKNIVSNQTTQDKSTL